jgi:hypothetical protein
MNMMLRSCLILLGSAFVASCATVPGNLQGIPQGLTAADRTQLATSDLAATLGVANALQQRYQVARDENLQYAYWSNVAFVPLAALAAGAMAFNAYKDLLASVGIAAGSLAGFNSFVNARNNAKVYQSGINGLDCIVVKLGPFVGQRTESLEQQTDGMHSLGWQAEAASAINQSFKFNTPLELAEMKNNPLVVANLVAADKMLTQALADAQKALGDARNEIALHRHVSSFAADSIRQVNVVVSSKIAMNDINFSALQGSISGLAVPPSPAPAPPQAAASREPQRPSPTPLADATSTALQLAQSLSKRSRELAAMTQQFGLTAQEKAVAECIKSVAG